MTVGTKSLLWGVHAIWYHPWVVAKAYRHVHGVWPSFDEWLCIAVHDWGYWGCENMDGEQGRRHPELGAYLAFRLVYWWYRIKGIPRFVANQYAWEARDRTLYHSSNYSRICSAKPSVLYLPDKASILFEPKWFYIFCAKLSGEIYEYIENSPLAKLPPELKTPENWYSWYTRKVREQLEQNKICGSVSRKF